MNTNLTRLIAIFDALMEGLEVAFVIAPYAAFPVIILWLLASLAFGSLGQTPDQFEPGQPTLKREHAGVVEMVWIGKTRTHTGWFKDNHAVMEIIEHTDQSRLSPDEIGKIMIDGYPNTEPGKIEEHTLKGQTVEIAPMFKDGKRIAFVIYVQGKNQLIIVDIEILEEAYPGLATSVHATPTPDPEKKDCMIVATEYYARLKPVAYWVQIMAFSATVNGVPAKVGHAVVVWKLSRYGHVLVGDAQGTVELQTASESVTIILDTMASNSTKNTGKKTTIVGHFVEQ